METSDWKRVVIPRGHGHHCACEIETLHYLERDEGWCLYVKEPEELAPMPAHFRGRMKEELYGEEDVPEEEPPPTSYFVRWGRLVVAQGEVKDVDSAKGLALEVYKAARELMKGEPPGLRPQRAFLPLVQH